MQKKFHMLIVDNDLGDQALIRECVSSQMVDVEVSHVAHGDACLDFLLKKGKYQNEKNVDLVLLDLNVPRKNGRKVLKEIRTNDSLVRLPVIVMTTSKFEQDVQFMYSNGANCYINKPVDLDGYMKIMKSVVEFWFGTVLLPSRA